MTIHYFLFFLMIRRPPRSTRTDTLFPYTTLFRSILIDRKLVLHRAGRDLIDIVAEPALEGGQLQRCVFALMPDEQLRAPAPLALQRRIADLERLCSGMRPVGEQLLGRRGASGTADVRSEEQPSELQSIMRISY